MSEFQSRCEKLVATARIKFHQTSDWLSFYIDILGVNGTARQSFPTRTGFLSFLRSPHYQDILDLVESLRTAKHGQRVISRPIERIITVRLPSGLHESLKAEAEDMRTSLNKLCISKLLNSVPVRQAVEPRPINMAPASFRSTATSPVSQGAPIGQ